MVAKRPGGKSHNWYEKGEDEALHVYMKKSSMLKRKVKTKALFLGYRVNEYVLKLLEDAVKDVTLSETKGVVRAPEIAPKKKDWIK